MKMGWSKLSRNRRLALIAIGLGALAIVAGSPYRGAKVTIDTKELSLLVNNEVDHIDVLSLADWLIQGKADFRLIDLRTEKEYSEYHIPQSENIPIASLVTAAIPRSEKVILYSEGGIHSAQAWFFLRSNQYRRAYILRGGLEEWKDRVLFPKLPENANAEASQQFKKIIEVSKHFGGSPQTGAAAEQTTMQKELPKLPAVGVFPVVPTGGGKKKKEGC
ncbi:MAG: rhodanese-like domain-containing protein [bacterium]|nr:rhodanese-like domain-containing protein [bacterium]